MANEKTVSFKSANSMPEKLSGTLLKQSPNSFKSGSWQRRQVVIQEGHLMWSVPSATWQKGRVDLGRNKCIVEPDADNASKFCLRPLGDWIVGDFTGYNTGRMFYFDASGSEHTRDTWIQAVRSNIGWMCVEPKTSKPTKNGDPIASFDLSSVIAKEQALESSLMHAKWQELKNDMDVKDFAGSKGIPLGKLRLSVPANAKGCIAIIAAGSYSPPTTAHFRVLEDARDHLQSVGIHVLGGFMSPTHIAYGKKSLVDNFHRVNMLGAALQYNDWIAVDPWECSQDGWTETALVIDRYQKELDQLSQSCDMAVPPRAALLGGADLVESFAAKKNDGTPVWAPDDVEKIVSRGVICVARDGFNLDDIIAKNELLYKHKANIHVVIPPVENNISSTLIRNNLAAGKSIKYIVHDAVIEYIQRHRLHELSIWK